MNRPKLLCVDDRPINIQILYQIFGADHEMFMATDGRQALELCNTLMPDLILLDVLMPEMDGYEVCRELKKNPLTANIPVIFVTAQHNSDAETTGLSMGAVDFICRPFNAAVVRARVHTHVQLYRLKENLEEQVRIRSNELERAQQQLHDSQEKLTRSEARATFSTLIASVSHELSSPIGNSVMASSSLREFSLELRKKAGEGTIRRSDIPRFLDELDEAASLIERNLRRASDLLSNFRQVSADQASEQRRVFDLAETINEIIGTIRPSLKRKSHRIQLDVAPDIEMDSQPGFLGQIVINLINNAYLHAFENRNDGLLIIHAEPVGDQVLISFKDNGCGIAQGNLDKIFEPFFSTKIGAGGTGLGMAIVHNLVTKTLRGSIAIQSTLGQGTQIDIRLPRVLPQRPL